MIAKLGLAAALLCAAVPAQAMTVAEFLAKAHALQARGLLAIGSPDIKLLQDEVEGIRTAYRADLARAAAAHRPPHSCPPPQGQSRMSSSEFIAELERIPAARRGISMRTAFYAIMKRRYPCR
ncbi:MAG: hypothetical protein V4574_12505 [Pseudomonadota bacterium]